MAADLKMSDIVSFVMKNFVLQRKENTFVADFICQALERRQDFFFKIKQ